MLSQLDALLGLNQLPALTPIESAVAKAWLLEHAHEYDSVVFNVRLGAGVVLPGSSPEFMHKYARASTTKRADMILLAGTVATIVEVKIRAGGSALGQLQLYKKLYRADHPEVSAVNLMVAAQTIEPDVDETYQEHGITVELFPSVTGAV